MRTFIAVLVTLVSVTGVFAAGEPEAASPASEAAVWPSDTITIIVGVRAGGNQDLKARLLARYLSEALDTPVVVENIPGASGSLAAVNFLEGDPDPHVLYFTPLALLAMNPIYQDISYSAADFQPVASFDTSQFGLFVRNGGQFETFDDLIAYGQDNLIQFGSNGPGAANYLYSLATFSLLDLQADTITHGNANQGLSNVVAGTTDVTFAALNATAIGYVTEGELIPILTYADSPVQVGDIVVPPAQDYGLDLAYSAYTYISARAGIDPEIIDLIAQSIYSVYDDPEYQAEAERLQIVNLRDSREMIEGIVSRTGRQARELHELITAN